MSEESSEEDDGAIKGSRFSVFVPTPEVKLNMGYPVGGDEAFGYTGMSIKSAASLFVGISKVSLFHVAGAALFESGKDYFQWAGGEMFIAANVNATVAAARRIVIAAGAGQSILPPDESGRKQDSPRLESFNSLELHYGVEAAHNGLRKLFYGEDFYTAGDYAKSQKAQVDALEPTNKAAPSYAAGLLKDMVTFFDRAKLTKPAAANLLQPFEWQGDYLETKVVAGLIPYFQTGSVYPAIAQFDPYQPQAYGSVVIKALAILAQVSNGMQRLVDALKSLVEFLIENPVKKAIMGLINAWGSAQGTLNAALRLQDFRGWDDSRMREIRDTKSLTEGFSGLGTKATLTTKAAPFDFTGVASTQLYIDICDVEGGTLYRVSFAAAETVATLTVNPRFKALRVSVSDPAQAASITVGSVTVDYLIGQSHFAPPPAGYQWTSANQGASVVAVLERTDGVFFDASAGANVTIAEDISGSLSVSVNGTVLPVQLACLGNSTVASERATALAEAIGSAYAESSGAIVTITERLGGPIRVEGTAEAIQRISRTAALVEPGVANDTLEFVRERLNGVANYSLTGEGPLTLTHNVTGKASYLEVSGPLADTLFGTTHTNQGADADFKSRLAALNASQAWMVAAPEKIKLCMRPVYEALADVTAVWDGVAGTIQSLVEVVAPAPDPAQTIGLFARDGISLGGGAQLFGTGKDITFVATEPDSEAELHKKFLPEWPLEWKGPQFYKEYKAWCEGLYKPVKKKLGNDGGFRVVAAKDIVLISADNTRLFALKDVEVIANDVKISSLTDIKLSAPSGTTRIEGTNTVIAATGKDAAGKASPAPNWVSLEAPDKLALITDKLLAHGRETIFEIGQKKVDAVDADKPRLFLSADTAALGGGGSKDKVARGVVVTSASVAVLHPDKVSLAAGGKGLEVTSAGVKISGQFSVGATLVVKDSGMIAAAAIPPEIATPDTKPILLTAEYNALMAVAKALVASITATRLSLAALGAAPMIVFLYATERAKESARLVFNMQLDTQATALTKLKDKWSAVMVQAKADPAVPAIVAKEGEDRAVFDG
ncbi:MAG: hypothetical protein EXR75_04570 [Myxococcales bacterium]|nr:hypothetical protein [Myxococcales bacterium]